MAALDFPSSPTVGQVFTSGSQTWVWDGEKWNTSSGAFSDAPANGASIRVVTTIAGGTSNVISAQFGASGGVYIGQTPVDPGANNLQMQGAIIAPAQPLNGWRNKIRNGNFSIWQRGLSVAIPTTNAFGPDGWIIVPTGAGVTASKGGNAEL